MRRIKKSTLLVSSFFGFALLLIICFIGGLWLYISSFLPSKEEAHPSWAPDGQRLAFECYLTGPTEGIAENSKRHYTEEAADICTIDSEGTNLVHLTKEPGEDRYPVWSPNATQIAYNRRNGIYVIDADGTNRRQLVHIRGNEYVSETDKVAWSPDGSRLLFSACLGQSSERDVYVVDVETGEITNYTENNGLQDLQPKWTLNGTKIVFLSTASTLMPHSCLPDIYHASFQLRVINGDGSTERIVYGQPLHFVSFTVLNTGQIAFVSDLMSKTVSEYLTSDRDAYIYKIDLDQKEPIEWIKKDGGLISLSPEGKYLMRDSRTVLELETGKIYKLPPINPLIESIDSWSPDSEQIAITVSENETGFYSEKHIYIFDVREGSARYLIKNK
jgi:Tol biopolymer transport system component